jgi:hypothetical protein
MHFYNFFLKFYSLKFLFYNIIKQDATTNGSDIENNFDNIVIAIGENGEIVQTVNEQKVKCANKNTILRILGIVYFVCVLFVIGWQCLYSVIKSIIELDIRYFTSSCFSFLYLGQLVTGVLFYNGKFFNSIFYKTESYHTILLILLLLASVASFILSFISIVLLLNGYNLINYTHIYNEATDGGKIFIVIAMFLENFYSYNIFFVNIIMFAAILQYQRVGILTYLTKLGNIINGNVEDMTITSILEEFAKMKSHYKKTVLSMNFMFASITVIGMVASYFTLINIGTEFAGIFSYIDLALFLIIEAVYIFTISQINDTKGEIRSVIGSATFITKFMNKNSLNPIYGDVYENNRDIGMDEDRVDVELDDLRSTRAENNRMIMDTYECISDRGIIESEKKIDLIKNMTFRNIIISNQNGVSLDWIVLYSKLSEGWQPFKIFSYDIDNAQIVQKLVMIIFGLSAIIRLNFKIGI